MFCSQDPWAQGVEADQGGKQRLRFCEEGVHEACLEPWKAQPSLPEEQWSQEDVSQGHPEADKDFEVIPTWVQGYSEEGKSTHACPGCCEAEVKKKTKNKKKQKTQKTQKKQKKHKKQKFFLWIYFINKNITIII